jgi:hypothetical protein
VPSRHKSAGASAGISRHPREAVGVLVGVGAVTIIFINALFLQPGPHPAPIFAPKSITRPAHARFVPAPQHIAAVPAPSPRPHIETRHNDPIAQLLEPSDRVIAVQRVLTDYGYGQIRPTGIVGPDTQEAIRKFERSRRMPVTGALSDEVVRALAQMSGRKLD